MIPRHVAKLKFLLLSQGIYVEPEAAEALTHGGHQPLFIGDYPTTNGLTLRMPADVFVNAPIASRAEAAAKLTRVSNGFLLVWAGEPTPVEVLPVPAFEASEYTRPLGVATYADRVRVSPVGGCAYACAFCDSHLAPYCLRDADELLAALSVATGDPLLSARHALISGGAPRREDLDEYTRVCERLIAESPIPIDVMLAPEDPSVVDRFIDAGVWGLSMNMEVFGEQAAAKFCPSKAHIGRAGYARAIEKAVDRLGHEGRVRSLLIVGLEPSEDTLAGVDFIASLGCDPVLSPFRPAAGTPLANHPVPQGVWMQDLYERAREVAVAHGVALGPRCIPCQHNTATLPEPDSGYYFS